MTRALRSASLLLLAAGCFGNSELGVKGAPPPTSALDPDTTVVGPNGEISFCTGTPSPGPAPLRRLSHVEYRNTLVDLFGDETLARNVSATLVSDPVSLGFSNSAQLLDVKPVLAQQYMEAAEAVATQVSANPTGLLGCDPAGAETACITQFLGKFLGRAYRRPATNDEVQGYLQRFQTLRGQYDLRTGVEWIVATALQSPGFLYRPEFDAPTDPAVRPVRPYELASRLSFFLWHSIPDEALLAAAAEGRLNTKEDVEREAERLLLDPRAGRVLHFFNEWLDLDKLGNYARDPALYPNLPENLPELFRAETQAFARHVVFEGDGKLKSLLTADYTYVNGPLATHYGLPSVSGSAFVERTLPPGRRGIWMQGGVISAHDKANRTSIVNRGLRLRTQLLCTNVDAPPDNVSLTLGPVDPTASQADRLAEHRTNPTCASCHDLLDPLGQTFENVDAVGRLRTQDEGGHTVVTAGAITKTDASDGPVADGVDLLTRLADSDQVRQCFATQMFRYVHGREERLADRCSREQAFSRFKAADYDVRALLLGLVTADDFLYRAVPAL